MAKKTRVTHSGKAQKFEPGVPTPVVKRPPMPKSTVDLKHKMSAGLSDWGKGEREKSKKGKK